MPSVKITRVQSAHPGYTLLINVSSGTPQMQNALCVLKAIELTNVICVQVSHPHRSSGSGYDKLKNYLDPYEPEEKVVAEWIDQNTAGNVPVNRCTELDLPSHIGIILRKTIKSQLFEQDYYGACQTMSHQGNRRFFTVIDDEDATAMLINGLRISSYRLSSGYYPLKGAKIPGFIGEVTLTARLPSALMELAKPLLYFSRYGGTGIKYALGMGGVDVWG